MRFSFAANSLGRGVAVLETDGDLVAGLDGELAAGLAGEPVGTAADGGVPDGAGAEMPDVAGRFGHPASNSARVRREQTVAADRRDFRMGDLLDKGWTSTASDLPLRNLAISISTSALGRFRNSM